MALFTYRLHIALFLSCILLPIALGDLVCEELPKDVCAYSVSGSGKRCVLESAMRGKGSIVRECKSSGVVADNISNHIESESCMRACGVTRNSVGISAYAFLDPPFTAKLCSPDCFLNCPNIVDFYSHLAAGVGEMLGNVCETQRRRMGEKKDEEEEGEEEKEAAPPGPGSRGSKASDVEFPDYEAVAPAPSPSYAH